MEQTNNTPEVKESVGVVPFMERCGFGQYHLKTILALLVRDREFYETFAPLIKPYDFSTSDPKAPHEAMEQIWIITNDQHGKVSRNILKHEIDLHFQKYKKDKVWINEWFALVDEIYDAVELEDAKDYYFVKMVGLIQVQELKLSFHKAVDELNLQKDFETDKVIKAHHDKIGKILELGIKDQTNTGVDSEEFLKIEFPPKKVIIHPWLKERSVGMIAGQMGSGKTFLGITIANGVTTGTAVGNWIVENPIPCVYVDGELEHRDMQDRLRNLGIGKRIRKLHLISDAFNVSANLPRINNLLDPNQQAILFRICEKCKDNDFGVLLILDNISVLCPGIDENKKSDWDPINVWLLDLKKSGVNSLYDHHTGKSGDQRGTSAHEDNLDTSIQISLPKDYRTEGGCRFNFHFKKKRVDDQYLHLIRDEEWRLNTKEKPHQWEITTSTKKSSDEIFLMLAQGIGVTEVAKSLKISHSYVSKIKNKLTANGYFNIKGDLTDKGKQKLNSLTQDDDLEDE